MKASTLLFMICAGISFAGPLAAAEKTKKPADFSGYPFWATEKQPRAPQFITGLNAVLELTEGQKEQIAGAQAEFDNDPSVQAARSLPKSKDKNAAPTEEQIKAKAAMDAATKRLDDKVKSILTEDQRALIAKVNAARAAAAQEIGAVYADKFGSIKGDEAARKRIQEEKNQDMEDQLLKKLDAILSPSQKEAMARAAEAEERRAAEAATKKKPLK